MIIWRPDARCEGGETNARERRGKRFRLADCEHGTTLAAVHAEAGDSFSGRDSASEPMSGLAWMCQADVCSCLSLELAQNCAWEVEGHNPVRRVDKLADTQVTADRAQDVSVFWRELVACCE